MNSLLHSYWDRALRRLGWRAAPAPAPASRAPVAPADADWLADSALGEEDPGASLEALQRAAPPLKDRGPAAR